MKFLGIEMVADVETRVLGGGRVSTSSQYYSPLGGSAPEEILIPKSLGPLRRDGGPILSDRGRHA